MIKTTIVCFGDSITAGYGVDVNVGFVDRLEKYLPLHYPSIAWNIINSGIYGDTTTGALKRVERDVINYNPNIVFILFGSNDSSFYDSGVVAQKEFEKNLEEIIKSIRSHNNRTGLNNCMAVPVLITPPPVVERLVEPFMTNNRLNHYVYIIRSLAAKYKCPLLDFNQYLIDETEGDYEDCIQPDGLHVSQKGYDHLYDLVFSGLTKLINYEGIMKDYEI